MKRSNILLEKNVPCTLRDGTVLYADIYRPDSNGPFPVLLCRLPYSKDLPMFSHRYLDTNRLVEQGYVVIIQDVRGRYESEGAFSPFIYEAKDGYDAVEWAASLPYASGKVGMFGLSYYGFTQLLAASERPPHLKAITPAMTLNDQRNNTLFRNGAFNLGLSETWALESMAPDLIKRTYKDKDLNLYAEKMTAMATFYNQIEAWFRHAPVKEWPPLKELDVAGFFYESLQDDLDDDYWKQSRIVDKYDEMSVPAYHIAGWYDSLLSSTLENYVEMTNQAEGIARENQKLIIGPWGHGDFGSVIGERSFGVHASEDWIDLKEDLTDLHIRWFDHWLKGKDTQITEESPVKLFVMGENRWREEQEWPLARTQYTPCYLHSHGKANTRFGNGLLSFDEPLDEPVDHFVYNPEDPVPTQGGATLYAGVNTMGPRDQRGVEEREDVLVYTSEPLKEKLEVTGPIKVKLWASTDAQDTDFTAKLIDVMPDGTAFNLMDGIVRARYRNGYKSGKPLEGEIVAYEIDLWATSNVFLPGHSIRVEISSSNFPQFDANLNTGETMIESSEMQTANQTIYHHEQYPSHIVLPIIPAEK